MAARNAWARLVVPTELRDLLQLVAHKQGYKRDELHKFIYAMLKYQYPIDVETLAAYMGADWMNGDEPAEPPPDD